MLQKHTLFGVENVQKTSKVNVKSKEHFFSQVEPVQFVGQEQDGTLLFTWEDHPPGVEEGELVTYMGTYNPYRKTIHAVFVHEHRTNIVNATINRSHTFIGFVSHETVERTGHQGKLQPQGVYKAFIAEIQPQNRVFYLNLERENYLKLQFVYGSYRNPGYQTISGREDHLLVFLHKESIGLYHLPLVRVGDEAVIMSGEPRKEQLFHRRFVWVEWDSANQRLYIVHFLKSGKNERGQTVHQPYLKCYQFLPQEALMYSHRKDKELVLDMPLDLPIPYLKESTYLDIAPYQGIPDSAINMKVLSQPNGALCLCFQHLNTKKVKSDPPGVSTLQYSIYLLHKDKVLQGQCTNIPYKAAINGRLFFSWMDGYVLVHLPGHMTHLLCVGVEYDPGMHVLYHDTGGGVKIEGSHLITYTPDRGAVSNQGACFYDVQQREAFRFLLDPQVLLAMFESCDQIECKMSILHYAVVQTKDLTLMKAFLSSICKSPTDLDTISILQEFLIGHTYTQLRRQVYAIEKKMLKFIPYTSQDCGEKHSNRTMKQNPCIQSSISYSMMPEVSLLAEKQEGTADFWQLLTNHMEGLHSAQNCRFDLLAAKLGMEQNSSSENKQVQEEPSRSDSPSIFQKISAAARNAFSRDSLSKASVTVQNPVQRVIRTPSRVDSLLGRPPGFLGKDEEAFMKSNRYFSKTVELLSIHLIKHNKHDSRTKIRSIAEEYVKCQMSSSRLLCHLIWSVMATDINTDDIQLSRRYCRQEVEMLKMLERFVVSVELLGFPLPSGVTDYMMSLGFRCSALHTFLQYVDQGVYSLSPEFVLQVIEDLPDTPKNVEIKWHLLHRLSQDCVIQCLRHWDHPSAMQTIGQYYSEMVITKQVGWEVLDMSMVTRKKPQSVIQHENITEHDSFPPGVTFVKYLQKKDNGLISSESSSGVELSTDYLRRAAVAYMSAL